MAASAAPNAADLYVAAVYHVRGTMMTAWWARAIHGMPPVRAMEGEA